MLNNSSCFIILTEGSIFALLPKPQLIVNFLIISWVDCYHNGVCKTTHGNISKTYCLLVLVKKYKIKDFLKLAVKQYSFFFAVKQYCAVKQ